MMRFVSLFLLLGALSCGGNVVGGTPDAGPRADQGVDQNYPPGPYGINEGDVLQNMTFSGYVNMAPGDGVVDQSGYEDSVSLASLRENGYRYVLFNVAAIWCVACQTEARDFPGYFEDWAPKGGFIMSVLIEDAQTMPANKGHLDSWVSMYQPNYTMLHDPQDEVTQVLAPANLPLNAMIDLDTMRILRIRQGDDPEFIQFFEERLNQ